MELLYIHIFNDNRNIKNCEFNFSPNYRFAYDIYSKRLTMTRPNKLPPQWFGPNIKNITGIIGKNGAGKSNLIEYIIKTLCYQNGGIIIWKYNNILYRNKMSFEITCDFDLKEWHFWGSPFGGIEKRINDAAVIYYSPTIDRNLDHRKNRYHKFHDISNSFLLRQKHQNHITVPSYAQLPDVEHMRLIDTFRLILFFIYTRGKGVDLPSDLRKPQYLRLEFHLFDDVIPDHPTYLAINKTQDKTFESQLKYFITRQIFGNLSIPESWNENTTLEEVLYTYCNDIDRFRPNIYDVLVQLYNEKRICCKLDAQKPTKIGDDLYLSIETDALSIKFLSALFAYYFRENPCYASFSTLKFLSNKKNDFIFMNWDGMSSGEYAFYNFISRLYGELYQIEHEIHIAAENQIRIQYRPEIKNVILILDEAELSFHPEWQQKFMSLLIDSLNLIFHNIEFQIILASHSPILISDIPKSNIIFLRKNSAGECQVCNPMQKHETFGANIHTLFEDSFFLNGLPIGDFAKRKIQNLFDRLSIDKDCSPQILSEIELVGEPVLRNQLKKLFDENMQLVNVDTQICILEQKIEQFKHQKHDRN